MTTVQAETGVEALAPPLQEWWAEQQRARGEIWAPRPIQRTAFELLLADAESDVVLAASTASGKTEAVFLPLLTRLHRRSVRPAPSFEILYLSPLKALINDMAVRVRGMAAAVGRGTYRRHGDVGHAKDKATPTSRGVLLTTPESLEAQFILHPDTVAFAFADLQAVVVDEIHAYFESERGAQVLSLLARLEAVLGEERGRRGLRLPRYALSATVGRGDAEAALCAFLRPDDPGRVRVLSPDEVHNELRVWVRGFRRPRREMAARPQLPAEPDTEAEAPPPQVLEVARSLYKEFSGCEKGLVFTNSRREAEEYAEALNRLAVERGLVAAPPEPEGGWKEADEAKRFEAEYSPESRRFWPHHGSLKAKMRSRAEKWMRDQEVPSVLVCTSTLELGIDVGTVRATAQIGPGYTVASLRQRLGRSGRREGEVPTLYACVLEGEPADDDTPVERLHLRTFRTLAQIRLLAEGLFEPPDLGRLHLSTLIQQLLSAIHQQQDLYGLDVETAKEVLCRSGPFGRAEDLVEPLLDHLSRRYKPLVEAQDGRWFLTDDGCKYVRNFNFYAAFPTPREYTVRAGILRIGSFAPRYPYGAGDQFLFAGAYWRVASVDHRRRELHVTRAASGRAPYFEGEGLAPSLPVVREMRRLYAEPATPPALPPHTQLNRIAGEVLEAGRAAYRELFAEHAAAIPSGGGTLLFPWVGTRQQITLVSALKWAGLAATALDLAVYVWDAKPGAVLEELARLRGGGLPGEHELARYASKLEFEKHDWLLSPSLKRVNFAAAKLDLASLPATLDALLEPRAAHC